jgi:MFS family permease
MQKEDETILKIAGLSTIHGFWLNHIHAFYVNVRFIYAVANALTTAIATIYLLSKGLSYTEIGVVWSIALFFSTVLDFPTGNFADLYGRKLAFIIGVISIGVGNFVYGLGTTLWMFFLAAFFTGLGSAQISGSISSWVVDEQIEVDRQGEVNKIFGDGGAAASIGGIIGGTMMGLFFAGPLEILYFFSGALFILTGIFVFVSIPDNYGQPGGRWISLPREVLSHFIHSLPLVVLSITLVLMYACFTVYFFVLQPLALELGLQEGDLGYLYAIYMAGSTAGAFIVGRISKKCGEVVVLLFCFVTSATGFFTIFLNFGIMGLVCGMVQFSFGYGGFIPVLYAFANTFIPSSIRASTSSLIGTIGTGGIILLQVSMGAFIEWKGFMAASLCAVVFALVGGVLLIILYKRM